MFKHWNCAFLLGAEPGDAGGAGGGAAEPGGDGFSREYVAELNRESKMWRQKAREAEQELERVRADAESATRLAGEKITYAEQVAGERVLRAELKAAALRAGMVDLDGLKLADLASVRLLDDGSVEGAEALMESLKAAKPYLFGRVNSTSAPHVPPRPTVPGPLDARQLTAEQYRAAKEKLI